jgi:hypothetical protein
MTHGRKLYAAVGTWLPQRGLRAAVVLVPFAVASVSGGCKERVTHSALVENAECSVIARFTAEPDSELLGDIGRTNDVALEPLAAITDDLRVYSLKAAGPDDDCMAAIERLRSDERVRSIELDARRELHNERSNAQGQR